MKFDGADDLAEALRAGFVLSTEEMRDEDKSVWYDKGLLNPYRIGNEEEECEPISDWPYSSDEEEWEVDDIGFKPETLKSFTEYVNEGAEFTTEVLYPNRVVKTAGELHLLSICDSYSDLETLDVTKHRWVRCKEKS